MKLKRPSGNGTRSYSGKGSIHASLIKVSEQTRKGQLAEASKPATPRAPLAPGQSRLKMNITGNLRGMHNAVSPPDSEKMMALRKMRKLWNRQMPVLQCNNCAFAAQCPQYKAQYECAFLPFLHAHQIDTPEDLIFYAKESLGQNLRRAQQAMFMETLSGAPPSVELSEQLGMMFTQLMQLHERMTAPDAQIELETEDKTIIGTLFGGLSGLIKSTQQAQNNPVEIPMVADQPEDSVAFGLPNPKEVDTDLVTEYARARVSTEASIPANKIPVRENE